MSFEVGFEREIQLIEARAGKMVADAVVAHRANWQGVQKTVSEVSCMDVLELGELTRRLRTMLRHMMNDYRMMRVSTVVSANDARVIAMASSRPMMKRDIKAIWALYRDMVGQYASMYSAYMFRLDLPANYQRPTQTFFDN